MARALSPEEVTAAGPPILDVEALVALVHDVEQASGHRVQDLGVRG